MMAPRSARGAERRIRIENNDKLERGSAYDMDRIDITCTYVRNVDIRIEGQEQLDYLCITVAC